MERGVLQGSVLGPLFWNIAYDEVLQGDRPPGCVTICYADDTLVLASGGSWTNARRRAEECAAVVLRDTEKLGR